MILFELEFGRRKIAIRAGDAMAELIKLSTERLREGRVVQGTMMAFNGQGLRQACENIARDLRREADEFGPLSRQSGSTSVANSATFFEQLANSTQPGVRYELSLEEVAMLHSIRRCEQDVLVDHELGVALNPQGK